MSWELGETTWTETDRLYDSSRTLTVYGVPLNKTDHSIRCVASNIVPGFKDNTDVYSNYVATILYCKYLICKTDWQRVVFAVFSPLGVTAGISQVLDGSCGQVKLLSTSVDI